MAATVRWSGHSPVTHVALLRGINVDGRHTLPVKKLVALFEEAGGDDVRTYIQSGNVIYRSQPALVASSIARRFAYEVPVVQRTADTEMPLSFSCSTADRIAVSLAF